MERYNFKIIEDKWQNYWEKNKSFSSKIDKNKKKFYSLLKNVDFNLEKSKVILIRNDPPFDNRYLYTTFLLNHISKKVKIINHPFAVRNISEKLFSINLMRYMPPTLVSENLSEIKSFFKKKNLIVGKNLLLSIAPRRDWFI